MLTDSVSISSSLCASRCQSHSGSGALPGEPLRASGSLGRTTQRPAPHPHQPRTHHLTVHSTLGLRRTLSPPLNVMSARNNYLLLEKFCWGTWCQLVLLIARPAWLFLNFGLGRKFAISSEHVPRRGRVTESTASCSVRSTPGEWRFSGSVYLGWRKTHLSSKPPPLRCGKFMLNS